jgi:hypothetical protein
LIRDAQRHSDDDLRESVILGGFTEMPGAFVFNPDNGIVCVMALIVHYCFDKNVGGDRKGEDQRGHGAA